MDKPTSKFKGSRRVVVEGVEYRWKVGKPRQNRCVLIRGPNDLKLTPLYADISSLTTDWDDQEVTVVGPDEVAKYIQKHLEESRW
jgi:hypothetical protein